MKREQIIEILQRLLQLDMPNPEEAEGLVADAILALDEQGTNLPPVEININTPFFGNSGMDLKQYIAWAEEQIKAMEEYRQQPQKEQEEEKPTDEMIEKWARTIRIDFATEILIEGAKAMRDNPKAFK